jgi:hypothetical protein
MPNLSPHERTAASGTNTTRSNASRASSATCNANRVLPTPPGPVSVSRRTSGWRSRSRSDAISSSRPTRGVSGREDGWGRSSVGSAVILR